MKRIVFLVLAVAVVAYILALVFMDETASDIANAAMLTAIVIMLFRLEAMLVSVMTDRSSDSKKPDE